MNAPRRIALFTYSTRPRGSVIHTLELATALHQLGHAVAVYALDKDGSGFDYPLACKYYPIPAQSAPAEIDRLIHQRIQEFVTYLSGTHLQQHSYDFYHAQDCISANALAQLRNDHLIPHFARTVHHIEEYNSPYLQNCQNRSILEPDLCLCISDYWQQQLQQQYQIHAFRVMNGINGDRFSPIPTGLEASLKEKIGICGTHVYLTVGGIEPRKNSLNLLKAFATVLAHLPQAQLVIAGGATLFDYQPYREEFFALAAQLKVEVGRSLLLPGVIPSDELPALYRTADAFVFPSTKEGWGLVVLEAIASGLPVLTAHQPPFTEFLNPDQALLVDPHSVDAIAQAMLRIAQPAIAQSLMQNSRSIGSRYTWEVSAKMHLTHYEKLAIP